jgi:hypothetical protein
LNPPNDPQSIDFAFQDMAKRRHIREIISMVCAGVIVTVMVVTFYSILTS